MTHSRRAHTTVIHRQRAHKDERIHANDAYTRMHTNTHTHDANKYDAQNCANTNL